MYTYRLHSYRVIDGDTIEACIDLGFNVLATVVLRLRRIQAPETRGTALTAAEKLKGEESSKHLAELLSQAGAQFGFVVIETFKDRTDKYGRYLAEIYGKRDAVPLNINDQMVSDKQAVSIK